jgi:hypothetical protein
MSQKPQLPIDHGQFEELVQRMVTMGSTPIALYGAGDLVQRLCPLMHAPQGVLAGIIDDDARKIGKTWAGLPVLELGDALAKGVKGVSSSPPPVPTSTRSGQIAPASARPASTSSHTPSPSLTRDGTAHSSSNTSTQSRPHAASIRSTTASIRPQTPSHGHRSSNRSCSRSSPE